eukprot:6181083-Pleurochrysis_carterae.AAC.1
MCARAAFAAIRSSCRQQSRRALQERRNWHLWWQPRQRKWREWRWTFTLKLRYTAPSYSRFCCPDASALVSRRGGKVK